MYQKTRPLFLLCETPLHAGSGSDLGVVDLPIQRERHTSYPKIESSSLKGALRERFESYVIADGQFFKYRDEVKAQRLITAFPTIKDSWMKPDKDGNPQPIKLRVGKDDKVQIRHQEAITLAFGPEDAGNDAHAGALGFTDARLLLFPVKSMKGVFAWITCPALLDRFQREMQLCEGFSGLRFDGDYKNHSWQENQSLAFEGSKVVFNDMIILEEYSFKKTGDKTPIEVVEGEKKTSLGEWLVSQGIGSNDPYWTNKLKTDIVILSDDDFKDFVNLSTEVITRTKINNETGTVQKGGLFTEEYLPTESLMYSLVMSAPVFQPHDKKETCLLKTADNVMNFFEKGLHDVIQLGGNATLGKGLLRTKLLSNPKSE